MRALFGGDPMLTETNGIVRLNKSSRTLTFYDAETGGAQVTDLLDGDGTTAISTVTTTGAVVPPFYGPDNVTLLWADAGDGDREPMRGSYESTALSAAYAGKNAVAPKWQASTDYAAGDTVLSPNGALVRAKAAFTSGATYDASNWMPANNLMDWVGNLGETSLQSWQWGTESRLSIAFYGDSITQGAWAGDAELTDWPVKGFVGKFRQAVQRIYGNGGLGFVGLFRKEWTKAGTWTQVADYGPFGQAWYATVNTATYTLQTKAGDGDNVDIFYVDTSAPFTYTIDGGAPVTVTPPGGATNKTIKVNVALPNNAAHSIQVIGPDTGTLYLVGAAIYNGTGGAVVHNIGKSGALIGDMGYSVATSDTRTQVITDHLKPRLNVVGFLANDYSSQTALETYSTRYGYLLDKVIPLGDTVMWAPPDNGITPVKTITTEQYEAEMKNLAVARGLPWVDIHAAWGDYTVAGDKMYDTQHPNDKGHSDIAARFLRLVRAAS